MKKLLGSLYTAFIGGCLGALGGAENSNKMYRRIGIPFILTGLAWNTSQSIWAFIIMSLAGVLSIGYGIPDSTDEGSGLGRFVFRLVHKNANLANWIVRYIVGILLAIPFIIYNVCLDRHGWFVLNLCPTLLTSSYIFINCALNIQGTFEFNRKKLSYVEFYTYFFVTLFGALSILL